MKDLTERLLNQWSDKQCARTMSDAEDLIHMLLVEIAGKEEVIKVLETNIEQNIRIIHTRQCTDDKDLDVQLFEVFGAEKPYRVRLIDKSTGEIGPQIRMYDDFGNAAKFYAHNSPIW